MSNKTAIVIGSGLAGLAASIRLTLQGYKVTVIEANKGPGGKVSEFYLTNKIGENLRFDAGPSLFTLPEAVDELFIIAGKNPRDYYTYYPLEITCKYFYDDGRQITAYSNPDKFASEIESKTTDDKKALKNYLSHAQDIWQITKDIFVFKSLHLLSTYLKIGTLKSLLRFRRIKAFSTLHQINSKYFKDKATIQIFDRFATYNGSNPYKAPATLMVISHLEHNMGAFFPKGGIYSITKALFQLAQDLGVQFEFETVVKKIITLYGKVAGVETEHKQLLSDIVVSNMDVSSTFLKLLREFKAPSRILSQEKSTSALIFYWVVAHEFADLEVHNILFSKDYENEFNCIKRGVISDDPTVYIYCSNKTEKNDAPAGYENWFVMINTPYNQGQPWDEIIQIARKQIIQKINRQLRCNLEEWIENEEILDPRKIERNTSSYLGALYGNSSNNKFSAFLRHKNFSEHLPNLFFCGGSVHPGGGIPMVLNSAKIMSEIAEKHSK